MGSFTFNCNIVFVQRTKLFLMKLPLDVTLIDFPVILKLLGFNQDCWNCEKEHHTWVKQVW